MGSRKQKKKSSPATPTGDSNGKAEKRDAVEEQNEAAAKESPSDGDYESSSEQSVYDSDVPEYSHPEFSDDEIDNEESDSDDENEAGASDSDSDDGFEEQGSSDEDEDLLAEQEDEDQGSDGEMNGLDGEEMEKAYERKARSWAKNGSQSGSEDAAARRKRSKSGIVKDATNTKDSSSEVLPESDLVGPGADLWMHTDDLSSDDEDDAGINNRIGRVPLHWYDEYDHIGYDAHGKKVIKSVSADGTGDRIDQALQNASDKSDNRFVVHDMLNDKNVELSQRQLEIIRRMQSGAYAHPEFDGNAEYIDYFSGVNQEISGIGADRNEPKARFQPSKWEALQVKKLLDKLEKGQISMDYLTGKVRDMNDVKKKGDPKKPYLIWKGDEEDELNGRKGPQHISAPKPPPPGHAESYVPPDEYLPTEEELKQWEEMEPKDRPHGLFVPRKFSNLRSVGAYEHSVREAFERCLDLYLCPRIMKRRLNIDPESLVPQLPSANDLRPFPTTKCIEYVTPTDGEIPLVRGVTVSPSGAYMASGASDGFVRLWEVATGRLLRSWDLSKLVVNAETNPNSSVDDAPEAIKPVVQVQWNPNRTHHCLLAAIGNSVVVIATGTASADDAELTDALLHSAKNGGNVTNVKAAKAVKWSPISSEDRPISKFDSACGPVCALYVSHAVANVRWHAKGDYFVSVSPKAGAPAVLIHSLSKGNSQQPFSKAKGEAQCACFHPNKPFLFVATPQHVRVYHLIKQAMVKRLVSGCRWISSLDMHHSGDHLIVGSLDRRLIWFDLDLSHTPYKTLKYHERALRSVCFHRRYPLMASASDDATVHIFHSTVYSDLMRNPLIVPVKILRGHSVNKKFGVLSLVFHPTQPWIFSAGSDGKIILYQDI